MQPLQLLEQFGTVRRSLGRLITPYLQKIDIGPKQLVVLRAIGKRGECSMSDVAEATASDMGSVTRMVAALVTAKWVEKRRDDIDRRQWKVRLAPKARKRWDTIDSCVHKIAEAFTNELDAGEREEFFRLLQKVQRGIENSADTISNKAGHPTGSKE